MSETGFFTQLGISLLHNDADTYSTCDQKYIVVIWFARALGLMDKLYWALMSYTSLCIKHQTNAR